MTNANIVYSITFCGAIASFVRNNHLDLSSDRLITFCEMMNRLDGLFPGFYRQITGAEGSRKVQDGIVVLVNGCAVDDCGFDTILQESDQVVFMPLIAGG